MSNWDVEFKCSKHCGWIKGWKPRYFRVDIAKRVLVYSAMADSSDASEQGQILGVLQVTEASELGQPNCIRLATVQGRVMELRSCEVVTSRADMSVPDIVAALNRDASVQLNQVQDEDAGDAAIDAAIETEFDPVGWLATAKADIEQKHDCDSKRASQVSPKNTEHLKNAF